MSYRDHFLTPRVTPEDVQEVFGGEIREAKNIEERCEGCFMHTVVNATCEACGFVRPFSRMIEIIDELLGLHDHPILQRQSLVDLPNDTRPWERMQGGKPVENHVTALVRNYFQTVLRTREQSHPELIATRREGGEIMEMTGRAADEDREGLSGGHDIFRFDDVGAEIAGVVTEVGKAKTQFGTQTVLHIESEDDGKTYAVFCSFVVLKRKIAALPLKPGDEIDIVYLGDAEKSGAKLFKVVVYRDDSRVQPKDDAQAPL